MLNSKVQSIMNGNGCDDDEVGFVLNAKSLNGKKNRKNMVERLEQGDQNAEVQKELMGIEEDFSIYGISEEDYYNEEENLVVGKCDFEEDFSIYDITEENFYAEKEAEIFDDITNCISEDIHTFLKLKN